MKTIDKKTIEKRQAELKAKKENGEVLGPLFGIEIALEDNISTKGRATEVGSKMLEGYIPPFDAEVVTRLLKNHAIIKAKVDTREFGVGEEIDSQMGQLVKDDQVDASIGIDAQGEIRSEGVKSHLYGLKPTYGSISRYGIIGSAPSLEQVGIISKTIDTMKLIFDSIAGKDNKDSTSLEIERLEKKSPKDIKIGILKEYMDIADKKVKDQVEKTIEAFKAMGVKIEYVSIPSVKYTSSAYKILQSAEFSSDMGKFDGLVYGFSVDDYSDNEDFFKKNRTRGFSEIVKKKIMFGNFVLSENNYRDYYEKSQKIRTLIAKEVQEAFKTFDIILNPIIGQDIKYTCLANLVGCPALSMASIDGDLGIQIMGDKFSEEVLFDLGKKYGQVLESTEKEGK